MVSNKIRIKSMTWSNVRNFEAIGYRNPEEKEIFRLNETPYSLLQIQNNYGKTTTMHLLRSIFTGIKIPEKFREGYRYRKGNIGWGGDTNAPSVFGVMFEINGEICENNFSISISFNVSIGDAVAKALAEQLGPAMQAV